MTEKEWQKRRSEGEPVIRSCWNCNTAHEHLKEADYIIWCYICGRIYYKGKELTELKKDKQ